MFLEQTLKNNKSLIENAFIMHQNGYIMPDSYIIDVDTLIDNAKKMLDKANTRGIKLYFMTKQLGRNPYLAKKLIDIGYAGAVVVDFKEAAIMMENHIPIGNVGHLVQIPTAFVDTVVAYKPEVITVYSEEKIAQIDASAKRLGLNQKILIRVFEDGDILYPGQTAGIRLDQLDNLVEKIKSVYRNITVAGVTSFPCYLYEEKVDDIVPTANLETVLKSAKMLEESGTRCEIVNTPSTTCISTIDKMVKFGGNCGEPGHGLTATTPLHAYHELDEKQCVVYLTEISHNFAGKSYCYGGGYYRRSHVTQAMAGKSLTDSKRITVIPPLSESIDYHFGLSEQCNIGDTVIMAFRYQIFVTRSDVVLIEGLSNNDPKIVGVFDSLGRAK